MRPLPVFLTIALLTAGCASSTAEQENEVATFVEVENLSSLDMNIHVVPDGGAEARLGSVTSHRTEIFRIPSRMIFGPTPLRFRADPIGSPRETVTHDVTVTPGDTVVMQIPPR